jgi:ProP effector
LPRRANAAGLSFFETVMSIATNSSGATTSKAAQRNRAWREARLDTLLTLRQRFPHTFTRLSNRSRRPLKIGIHLDIEAAMPDLDPIEISRALCYYVADIRYHRACTEGAQRIDLNGNPAGTVTASEAENSKRSVAGIEAKLAQRRERRAAVSAKPTPPITPSPKRLTLSDLKTAAVNRKANGAAP